MKKNREMVSKGMIEKRLAKLGLKMSRITVAGARKWVLSDGREFDSLRQVAAEFKVA